MVDPMFAAAVAKDVMIVGASHRTVSNDDRNKLVQLDDADASPVKALIAGGHARAVVRVATCARVEWVIVADRPDWAASLLEASWTRRAGVAGLHRHEGEAALRYLLSVALGLDSVVEGESAIGRQVLQAFASAHDAAPLDPTLRRLWHAIASVVSEKRRALSVQFAGVERLVADLVDARKPAGPISIFGRGEIARAIATALGDRGHVTEALYGRATLAAFRARLEASACVVVAASAHEAWLDLPARSGSGAPLCIDVSSPTQVRDPGGFELHTLDTLFAGAGAKMANDARALLQTLVEAAIGAYRMPDPTTPEVLAELSRQKDRLLAERLPPLLAEVGDPELRKRLRAELQSFSHAMITSVRNGRPGKGGGS